MSALVAATVLLSSCSSESGSNGQSDGSPGVTAGSDKTTGEPGENTVEAPTTGPAREDTTETSAASSTEAETTAPTAPQLGVTLAGTNGTKFSGRCVSGQQEFRLDGRVPDSFTFAPSDDGLECSIEKEGNDAGVLRVIVDAGDNGRSVQQTNADQSSINFSYADGSFSASSSSSSSSSRDNSSSQSSQNSR